VHQETAHLETWRRPVRCRLVSTPRRAFLTIFLLGLLLRLLLLPLLPLDPAWQLRQENGATAENLVRTGAYANPYARPTGPTAHPVPFYTAVIALSYQLFGVTRSAELARCLLAALSFSTLYALLPWVAARLGLGAPAGIAAGLLGALTPLHLPIGLFYGGLGEEFAALAMALLLVATLARWTARSIAIPASLLLGLAWGAAFHIVPALLLVMLACVTFEACWRRDRLRLLHPALLLLGAALACLPWTLRHYALWREPVLLRSNFGLELRLANHDGAHADMDTMTRREPPRHPRTHPAEADQVSAWGELEYMRRARCEALQWIQQNPGPFLQLTAARATHFWFGSPHSPLLAALTSLLTLLALLGARRALPSLTHPQRAALLLPLAAFPLVYYVVAYLPRYRVPVDWLLLLLTGVEIAHWLQKAAPADHPAP